MHNVNKALKWNNIFFAHGGKKQLKNKEIVIKMKWNSFG